MRILRGLLIALLTAFAGCILAFFVGDYLTTKGQAPEADYRMIEEMGFLVTKQEGVPAGHS